MIIKEYKYLLLEQPDINTRIFHLTLKLITLTSEILDELLTFIEDFKDINNPKVLITKTSNDKIYHAGINFKEFTKSEDIVEIFLNKSIELLGKFLMIDCPTIALVTGHAMAFGFMFIMAHDYRVIKSTSFCEMSEINLNVGIPRGMLMPLKAKMNKEHIKEMCLFGKRLTGKQLSDIGYATNFDNKEEIINYSLTLAQDIVVKSTNKNAFKQIKEELYKEYYDICINDNGVKDTAQFRKLFPKL